MASLNREQLVNEIAQLNVLDLVELVKALESKFGVSAAMPMAAAAPVAQEAGPKKEEEKSEYKVELVKAGDDKMKSIKALRSVTTLGLIEVKKLVEEAPSVIAEAASKDDAKKIKEALEAAGAVIKLS